MDNLKNKQNENLGVNKTGKNIRKSPLHQPNFGTSAFYGGRQHQPQPQVYNINKNDFRDVVQQLTGSSSHQHPGPLNNSPKPQSTRLQKIRPPPLPNVRPQLPMQPPMPVPAAPPQVPYNNALPPQVPLQGDMTWANNHVAESPISAYMRYFQNSMMDPNTQFYPQPQPFYPPQTRVPGGNVMPYPPSSALLPTASVPMLPSQGSNSNQLVVPVNASGATNQLVPVNSAANSSSNPLLVPGFPSPQANGPPLLPSPTSQFLLPSPTGYMNALSPGSTYAPLLSPGIQFPSPLTPNFPVSPGILGPAPQPPLSPGLFPPLSPGFFPATSPRWPDQ